MALTTKYCLDFFKRAAQITISTLEVKITLGIWVFFMKNHMYLIFFIQDKIVFILIIQLNHSKFKECANISKFRSGILARYIQNHDLRLQKLFYSSHAGYQRRLGY